MEKEREIVRKDVRKERIKTNEKELRRSIMERMNER